MYSVMSSFALQDKLDSYLRTVKMELEKHARLNPDRFDNISECSTVLGDKCCFTCCHNTFIGLQGIVPLPRRLVFWETCGFSDFQ